MEESKPPMRGFTLKEVTRMKTKKKPFTVKIEGDGGVLRTETALIVNVFEAGGVLIEFIRWGLPIGNCFGPFRELTGREAKAFLKQRNIGGIKV
jgi:hypothetical protein